MDELSRVFVSTASGVSIDREAEARLAPALEAHLERARARWPGVTVDAADYAAHLAARIPDETDPADALAAMHTEDLYLACACTLAVAGAAEAFERAIVPALPKAIARVDASPELVEDVVAKVRVKLLVGEDGRPPRAAAYLGTGPFSAFAQVAATREALSAVRRQAKDAPHDPAALEDVPIEPDDPVLARLRDQVREPFRRAFREALAELSPRERNVLRLYLIEDVSSETLASMYGVHRATIARWIGTAREAVLKGTRKRLMRELELGEGSFHSLVDQIASRLDLSLAGFLRE